MLYRKVRATLKTILILLLFCTAFVLLLNYLVQHPTVQRYLLVQLSKTSGYNFTAEKLKLSFQDGIGFSALGLVAKSPVKPESIEASRLHVTFVFSQLIKGRIVPSRIFILRPRVKLARGKDHNILKLFYISVFKKMIAASLSGFHSVSIKQASINVRGFPFELEDVDFDAYPKSSDSAELQLSLVGKIVSNNEGAPFTLLGIIHADEKVGGDLSVDMTLKTGKFPLAWVPLPASLSIREGFGDADINFKAKLEGPVSAEGKIAAEKIQFSFVRRGITKQYSLDHLEVDFVSLYSEKILEISSMRLKGPDFSSSANSKIDFKEGSNPHFALRIESPFMPTETFKRLFPTPFVRPWVNEQLFPILSGGDARLEYYSLNGTRDQLKHLRSPENRDVISMKVGWKGIDVLKNADALPFEGVSGELCIKNHSLSTTVNGAIFGKSKIANASLNVNSIYGERTYLASVEGQFDLNDLKQLEKLDVIPASGRQLLQGFQSVSGTAEGRAQVIFEHGWVNLRIINGEFRVLDCSVAHKRLRLPLSLDKAVVQTDGEGMSHFQGTGRWGKSEFEVSGATVDLWKTYEAQFESKVHINEIMDCFFQTHNPFLRQNDRIPCSIAVTREKGSWSIQGEANLDVLVLETEHIFLDPWEKDDKAFFDLKFLPGEKIYLNNLSCNLGESAFELNGSCDLRNKNAIKLNVSTNKLLLEDLGLQFKNGNVLTKGIMTCDVEIRTSFRNPLKSSVTGTMAGRDISIAFDGMPSPVNDCHFKLNFSGKDIFIRSFEMQLGQSTFDIQGHLQGWDGMKGEIAVNTDYLDYCDFINKEATSKNNETGQSRFTENSDILFHLKAQKGHWGKIKYGPLNAECIFRSGDFFVEKAEAQMENGSLSAKGHVKNEKGPERLFFATEIKLEKQPIEDLNESFGLKKGLEGLLTMEATLSAKGRETEDLISGLTGSAEFLVEEGRIKRKRGVVFKILEFLSLQNIIKRRMPDFSKEGYYFERLEASVNIEGGTFETDNLIFKSPIFNAAAQGTVCLPTEKVDFNLWVQTLEAVDSLICKVPIIGYILTEKENSPKGVIIHPYKIKGHWSNPEVKYSIFKHLGGGVINLFKRILLTPGHIFKEISEITTGPSNGNGRKPAKKGELAEPTGTQ